MALFGKSDTNLPYLTRFFQVNVPANDDDLIGSELFQFWLDVAQEQATNGRIAILGNGEDYMKAYQQRTLVQLAALHRLIVPLMEAMADNTTIPASLAKEINRLINNRRSRRVLLLFSPDGNEGAMENTRKIGPDRVDQMPDDSAVPVENLCAREVEGAETFDDYVGQVIDALFDLLKDAPATWLRIGQPVIRCAECHQPFINYRKGRTFCSARCANRATTKRKRERDANQNRTQKPFEKMSQCGIVCQP